MTESDATITTPVDTSPPPKRRRSLIYQIFHSSKSERNPSSKSKRKHHRSASSTNSKHSHNKSQFDKLKSIISNIFPKKSVRVKKKSTPRARKQRSRSFSLRRKKDKKHRQIDKKHSISGTNPKYSRGTKLHKRTASCHINLASSSMDYISETDEYKMNKIHTITPNTMNNLLDDIMEEDPYNGSLSETEEYKDNLSDFVPTDKVQLAPKSSSFMRSFEKRPEYITYYPPASLQGVFNNITVDEEERSVTVETKSGIKQRISAVDQLFELAEMTLDYSNFYGYSAEDINHPNYMDHNDEYALNEASVQLDASILSSYADDNEYDETLSWK